MSAAPAATLIRVRPAATPAWDPSITWAGTMPQARFPGARREPGGVVRVLREDPDLLRDVGDATAHAAREAAIAPALTLSPGAWRPPRDPERFSRHLGLLLLSGLIMRTIELAGAESPELIGAGDLIRPWDDHEGEVASVAFASVFTVLTPVRFAVLDEAFCRTICRWPTVVSALVGRTVQRTRWNSVHLALSRLQRIDSRLLLLLWHLADRWGRVRRDGVELPVRLTHAQLAKLVGAQRPSVTVALRGLAESGRVVRAPGGGWLLTGGPPEEAMRLAGRRDRPALLASADD
jgi:CRP/FNR family cyclic AMP-dependent transcriptional regulator